MFKVEARALLEGLYTAWEKGFKKIEEKSDKALLVDLITSCGGANSSLVEVHLLHRDLHHDWEVCVRHVLRSVSEVANHMAKCVTPRDSLLQIFSTPPISILQLLKADRQVSIGL